MAIAVCFCLAAAGTQAFAMDMQPFSVPKLLSSDASLIGAKLYASMTISSVGTMKIQADSTIRNSLTGEQKVLSASHQDSGTSMSVKLAAIQVGYDQTLNSLVYFFINNSQVAFQRC